MRRWFVVLSLVILVVFTSSAQSHDKPQVKRYPIISESLTKSHMIYVKRVRKSGLKCNTVSALVGNLSQNFVILACDRYRNVYLLSKERTKK